MRNGIVYPLPPLALLTAGTESGLLPTPTSSIGGANHNSNSVQKGQHGMNLAGAVKLWPTPTAHNAKEGAYPAEYLRKTPTLAAEAGGKLNPQWVEWLMGFPDGHTDLNNLETQLSPKSQS